MPQFQIFKDVVLQQNKVNVHVVLSNIESHKMGLLRDTSFITFKAAYSLVYRNELWRIVPKQGFPTTYWADWLRDIEWFKANGWIVTVGRR